QRFSEMENRDLDLLFDYSMVSTLFVKQDSFSLFWFNQLPLKSLDRCIRSAKTRENFLNFFVNLSQGEVDLFFEKVHASKDDFVLLVKNLVFDTSSNMVAFIHGEKFRNNPHCNRLREEF